MKTNSTAAAASVDNPVDEIANLLAEDDTQEDESNVDVDEDLEGTEGEPEESNEEDELSAESDEEVEGEDDAEGEGEEGDDTWSSVLGINEEKLAFDDDGNLAGIQVKVDGKVNTMKLDEVVAGFQNNQHNTQKSQALAEEKKVFEETKNNFTQEYSTKLEQATQLNDFLEGKLTSEFEGVDWEKLRTENPGEYSAARQDFAARAQEIQQARSVIDQEKAEEQKKVMEENQSKQLTYLASQKTKMVENNPTWTDEKVRKSEMLKMAEFVEEHYGFERKDLAYVNDARLIELIKDAQKFRKGSKLAKKKIEKKVPQFQKTNGKARRNVSKLDKLTKRVGETKGANRRKAQGDAITELLINGVKK